MQGGKDGFLDIFCRLDRMLVELGIQFIDIFVKLVEY